MADILSRPQYVNTMHGLQLFPNLKSVGNILPSLLYDSPDTWHTSPSLHLKGYPLFNKLKLRAHIFCSDNIVKYIALRKEYSLKNVGHGMRRHHIVQYFYGCHNKHFCWMNRFTKIKKYIYSLYDFLTLKLILYSQYQGLSIYRGSNITQYFFCLFVSLLSHFWLIHFFPPAPALSTIYRPLSNSMCSITPGTANVGRSYNRMRGPGIGCWFSDHSNCSHRSLTLTLTSENRSLFTTLLLLLVLIQLCSPRCTWLQILSYKV